MYDDDEYVDDSYETNPNDSRSVSHKDQIPYRTTIQKIVDNCLFLMGKIGIKRSVLSLKKALYFKMPGLPFKDLIDTFEKELVDIMIDYENERIQLYGKQGSVYYDPETYDDLTIIDKRRFKRDIFFKEYETEWLTFLISLLAEHEALLRAKGYVEEGFEIGSQMKKLADKTRAMS